MECSFIDKYIDKIYCSTMSFFDTKALSKHMKTCQKCKSAYEDIMEENDKLKETVLCDPPVQVGINVMKSIEGKKHKRFKMFSMKKYLAAAAVIVLLVTSSLYYLKHIGNPQNTGPGRTSGQQDTGIDREKLESRLKEYIRVKVAMASKDGKGSKGGQVFTAVDIFDVLPLEGSENTYEVYLWALMQEYSWVQGLIKEDEKSMALVVQVEKDGENYKPIVFHTEFNSSMDIYKLGTDYKDKLDSRRLDVSDLDEQIKKEAMEYYKDNYTPFQGTEFQRSAKTFIEKFGWTWTLNETTMEVEIPESFIDEPGEFPFGLYWAYCNVLSKDAGLDMAPYKGMKVTAHMMPLVENFGDTPNRGVRAIAIEKEGKLIGAWIDKGRGGGPWASLYRNYFDTITGKSWGQWLIDEGIEDNATGYESGIKNLTPEQVITKYYEAIDKKDDRTAFSLLSRAEQLKYMWVNMDDSKLYNEGFETGGEEILSAKVIKIEQLASFDSDAHKAAVKNRLMNRQVSDAKEFQADVNMDLKLNAVLEDGLNPRFIIMVKETSDSPWKIDANGTGP